MMNEPIWNGWKRDWKWVIAAMERKAEQATDELEIFVSDLEIAPPVPLERVRAWERAQSLVLPSEFVDVLTQFSASVTLHWQVDDDEDLEPPAYYLLGSSGGDWGYLWDFDSLARYNENLRGWLPTRATEEEEAAGLVWQNKVAFNYLPTGDLWAFDVSQGVDNCPVVFLGHEHGSDHGMRLGLNFVDFMTRWSNLGCPSLLSLRWLHDPVQNLLMDSGEAVEKWKRWVNE